MSKTLQERMTETIEVNINRSLDAVHDGVVIQAETYALEQQIEILKSFNRKSSSLSQDINSSIQELESKLKALQGGNNNG